jgi:dienelactone hydrolase
MPDYFRGNPLPQNTTGVDLGAWLNSHPVSVVDPIIEASIKYMRSELGVKNIGTAGYCFGGRFVARFLATGKGVKAGFTAHPSLVSAAEWKGVAGPVSIAAAGEWAPFRDLICLDSTRNDFLTGYAETDSIFPSALRRESEDILQKTGVPYQFALYGGTQHGFGVRVNLNDAKQKFAKESAFYQAIRWFDEWVKK